MTQKTQIPDAAVQAAANYISLGLDKGSTPKAIAENALTAAYPHLPLGYEVKKLELVSKGQRHPPAENLYAAETSFGLYMIAERQDGSHCAAYTVPNTGFHHKATNLDEAKAAAQADFERRVRECHEPVIITKSSGCVFNDLGIAKPVDVAEVRTSATNIEEVIQEYATAAFKRQGKGIPEYVWHAHFREFATAIRALSAEPVEGEQREPISIENAAKALLITDRTAIYNACEGICKVHRFISVLERLAAPTPETEA